MEKIREGMTGRRVAEVIENNFKYLEDKIDDIKLNQYNELLDRVAQAEQYIVDTAEKQVILADEEDTTIVSGTLKLADREYKGDGLSGKGFKILRQRLYATNTANCPINEEGVNCDECCDCCGDCCQNESIIPNKYAKNVLLQKDFNHTHTIFIVRYDFDLNGENITLLEDCELRFEGGTFKNGAIDLNGAKVHGMIGDYTDYFINVEITDPHKAQETIFNID